MVKYLVEHNTDVNCKTIENDSILHYAAKFCSLEIIKYFFETGADVNCKAKENHSVPYYAVRYGSLEIVKYFVVNCASKSIEECHEDQTVLLAAVKRGNETIVDCIIRNFAITDFYDCSNLGRSLMRIACHGGNAAIVRTLLKCKVDMRKEKT